MKGQSLLAISFPGPDESETELLGPDCQILGNPGLLLEDSQCGTADLGPLQPQQSKNRFFSDPLLTPHLSILGIQEAPFIWIIGSLGCNGRGTAW